MGQKPTTQAVAAKEAAALTTALAGWSFDFPVGQMSRVALLLAYVFGSASSVEVQIARSADGVTFYDDQRESAVLGTLEDDVLSRATAADKNLAILLDVSDTRFLRVTAKRTGGSAADTLAAEVTGGIGA